MLGFASSLPVVLGTWCGVWTRSNHRIGSTADLVEPLTTGADRQVIHRNGFGHRGRRLLEYGHLGYENSWKKIDRLLLSGDEPTHPRNLLYEGRFDDVRVY
mgnify:CR=1 FL=1